MDLLGWLLERGARRVEESKPDPAPDERAEEIAERERRRGAIDLRAAEAEVTKTEREAEKLLAETEEVRQRVRDARFYRNARTAGLSLAGTLAVVVIVSAILESTGQIAIKNSSVVFGGGGTATLAVALLAMFMGSKK